MATSPKKTKKALGAQGERIARAYLVRRGYRLVEKNYRVPPYEIDLIVEKDDTLVFVEVKARTHRGYGTPESFVDARKEDHLLEAAEAYLLEKKWSRGVRFDIVSVEMGRRICVRHFEDAFS